MTTHEPEWLEKLRLRWTQPNPSRFLRQDGHRFIRPDGDRFFQLDRTRFDPLDALSRKYSPNQPRVSAGNPDGGQWTSGGSGITGQRILSDESPDPIKPGAQYAAEGHHWVARGVFNKEKYSFRPETLKVLQNATTGALKDPTSNWFDVPHRQYNEAVEEALDSFLERNNIRSNQMSSDQARSFIRSIIRSGEPRIRPFIRRMIFRELQYWYRQGGRGRE